MVASAHLSFAALKSTNALTSAKAIRFLACSLALHSKNIGKQPSQGQRFLVFTVKAEVRLLWEEFQAQSLGSTLEDPILKKTDLLLYKSARGRKSWKIASLAERILLLE